jgi:hypothetical protein
MPPQYNKLRPLYALRYSALLDRHIRFPDMPARITDELLVGLEGPVKGDGVLTQSVQALDMPLCAYKNECSRAWDEVEPLLEDAFDGDMYYGR